MRRKAVVRRRRRVGPLPARLEAHRVEFSLDGKTWSVKLDAFEVEALNETAGSKLWWRPKELGGAPAQVSPSLNKLAAKGLLERRDIHHGLWSRATWEYCACAAGEAALAAAVAMGWRAVGGWPDAGHGATTE